MSFLVLNIKLADNQNLVSLNTRVHNFQNSHEKHWYPSVYLEKSNLNSRPTIMTSIWDMISACQSLIHDGLGWKSFDYPWPRCSSFVYHSLWSIIRGRKRVPGIANGWSDRLIKLTRWNGYRVAKTNVKALVIASLPQTSKFDGSWRYINLDRKLVYLSSAAVLHLFGTFDYSGSSPLIDVFVVESSLAYLRSPTRQGSSRMLITIDYPSTRLSQHFSHCPQLHKGMKRNNLIKYIETCYFYI